MCVTVLNMKSMNLEQNLLKLRKKVKSIQKVIMRQYYSKHYINQIAHLHRQTMYLNRLLLPISGIINLCRFITFTSYESNGAQAELVALAYEREQSWEPDSLQSSTSPFQNFGYFQPSKNIIPATPIVSSRKIYPKRN